KPIFSISSDIYGNKRRYYFFAAAFRRSAQRFFMRSDNFFRPAGVMSDFISRTVFYTVSDSEALRLLGAQSRVTIFRTFAKRSLPLLERRGRKRRRSLARHVVCRQSARLSS